MSTQTYTPTEPTAIQLTAIRPTAFEPTSGQPTAGQPTAGQRTTGQPGRRRSRPTARAGRGAGSWPSARR